MSLGGIIPLQGALLISGRRLLVWSTILSFWSKTYLCKLLTHTKKQSNIGCSNDGLTVDDGGDY